jgi:hypothetical protein
MLPQKHSIRRVEGRQGQEQMLRSYFWVAETLGIIPPTR